MRPVAVVILVAASDLRLDVPGTDVLETSPEAWIGMPAEPNRVVVLGPDALRRLDPKRVVDRCQRHVVDVVLWVGQLRLEEFIPWHSTPFEACVSRELAQRTVHRAWRRVAARTQRPLLALEGWCPGSGGSRELQFALELVPRLDHVHSVTEWARRSGWSLKELRRACRSELRIEPKEVLRCYVAAGARAARAGGATWDEAATMLGFHDGRGLRRCLSQAQETGRAR